MFLVHSLRCVMCLFLRAGSPRRRTPGGVLALDTDLTKQALFNPQTRAALAAAVSARAAALWVAHDVRGDPAPAAPGAQGACTPALCVDMEHCLLSQSSRMLKQNPWCMPVCP